MGDSSTERYRTAWSEGDFWDKLRRFARTAGREVVERALLLYLVLRDPQTPRWARTTVIGALGYFIAPIDAIPDFIPGAGFTDDLGVLALALTAVAASITPQMRRIARRTTARWFGDAPEPEDGGEVIEVEATVVGREQTV
jgi:uncharacterized membrane protein YkvA (DUF1232 family)